MLFLDNTLCRLVCKLLELGRCGDQSVVMETSRCLGVLGPADLKQMYIPASPPRPGLEKALECFQVRFDIIVLNSLLIKLLINVDKIQLLF